MKTPDQKRAYNAEYYQRNREKLLKRETERARERYANDKQKKLAGNRAWWEKNKDRHRATVRASYQANVEQERERNRQKHARSPDQTRARVAKRRARKRAVGGSHSEADIQRLYTVQRGMCAACSERLAKYHVDHVIPLVMGGSNDRTNLQLLCPPCNLSKGTTHPVEFMQRKGFLL